MSGRLLRFQAAACLLLAACAPPPGDAPEPARESVVLVPLPSGELELEADLSAFRPPQDRPVPIEQATESNPDGAAPAAVEAANPPRRADFVDAEGFAIPGPTPPCPDDASGAEVECYALMDTPPELLPDTETGMQRLQACATRRDWRRGQTMEGRVFVQFVVDTTGVPTEVQIARGLAPLPDSLALACVRETRFRPGTHGGFPVRTKFTLPVTFRLR